MEEAEEEEEEEAPPPQPSRLSAYGARRMSLSANLYGGIQRMVTAATAALTSAPAPEPAAPVEEAVPPPPPPPPAEPTPVESAPAAQEPAAVLTFDDYLSAAGVHFLDSAGGPSARASVGKGLGMDVPGYGDDEEEGGSSSVADRLMAAMVLQEELGQLEWARGELLKCIGVLAEGYQEMQEL